MKTGLAFCLQVLLLSVIINSVLLSPTPKSQTRSSEAKKNKTIKKVSRSTTSTTPKPKHKSDLTTTLTKIPDTIEAEITGTIEITADLSSKNLTDKNVQDEIFRRVLLDQLPTSTAKPSKNNKARTVIKEIYIVSQPDSKPETKSATTESYVEIQFNPIKNEAENLISIKDSVKEPSRKKINYKSTTYKKPKNSYQLSFQDKTVNSSELRKAKTILGTSSFGFGSQKKSKPHHHRIDANKYPVSNYDIYQDRPVFNHKTKPAYKFNSNHRDAKKSKRRGGYMEDDNSDSIDAYNNCLYDNYYPGCSKKAGTKHHKSRSRPGLRKQFHHTRF